MALEKKGSLDQGPFGIEQDDGWRTLAATTASDKPLRNYGVGLLGYTWEENGPSTLARNSASPLAEEVEKLASLPFVDVLYIRCDWRDLQKQAGRLDYDPVWGLTLDAAKRHGKRVSFRIQLSSPNFQPKQIAMPGFLKEKIPMVNVGKASRGGDIVSDFDFVEPKYDDPAFLAAVRELNELLARDFDGNPLIEFADLMMYGFWGEGHTGNVPCPFPDYATATRTMMAMTQIQLDIWKKTPLAVNTQPDISCVGNREIREHCIKAGCWLRTDSIIVEEPIQIDMISTRPQMLPAIIEDGSFRHYKLEGRGNEVDSADVLNAEKYMLHALDVGANYWALWTEADNLAAFHRRNPMGFDALRARLGYRVRPSWVWQRVREGKDELIVAFYNDGVAGVPGQLHVSVRTEEDKVLASGTLDSGQPFAGRLRQASFILPDGYTGKTVQLTAKLITPAGMEYPVQWSCVQATTPDGALCVTLKKREDKGWRKGV
jgi:hypothetical protein